MALHTDLPIHRAGVQLLQFAFKAQEHMPRGVKRSLGDRIADVCVAMLEQMALANATRGGGPPGDPNGEQAALAVEVLVRKYEGAMPRETLREALTEAYMMGAQNVLGRM